MSAADVASFAEPAARSRARTSCAYCGLPVAGAATSDAQYCCYGCRFAASIAEAGGETGQSRWLMMRLGLAVFCSMNVMVFTFFLWSQEGVVSAGAAAVLFDLARYICLLFTIPVLLLLGGPLAENAASEVLQGRPSLNLLLVLGSGAAFLYSLVSVLMNQGHVYFEVPCMVLVAVTLGRWLEATGKLKTTEALRELECLLPETVRRVSPSSSSGAEEVVSLAQIAIGDEVRILPGERIPIDGQIVRGRAALDEQLLTGESVPREKGPGDFLSSGTLNLDGELVLRATATAGASAVQQMIDAVTDALEARGRFQRLAERVAAWFLPLVVAIALVAFFGHWYLQGLGPALLAGLAVVVIACPCALGLATPMALWAAVGKAIRQQVLIRDGDALALLATAKTIAFDKTGTLTANSEVATFDGRHPSAAGLAVALAEANRHPLSQAISRWGDQQAIRPACIDHVRAIPGRGVQAFAPSLAAMAWLGSSALAANSGRCAEGIRTEGDVAIGWDGAIQGTFRFREQLRPQARSTLDALRARTLTPVLLSGDQSQRVAQVARELGIDSQAGLSPVDKLLRVQQWQERGPVVMVGDGLNDAPALAAADVGIALGCGADVSRWTATVCLLTDDLSKLPWLVDLARQTVRTIRWNLVWAFGYNALGIPLAAAGWLHPAVAAGAMAVSSLLVVANSLKLAAEENIDGQH